MSEVVISVAPLAANIARDAGAALVGNQIHFSETVSSTAFDIKVVGDAATESLIADRLLAETGLNVFGEESGWHGPSDDPTTCHWVIDPLDGSVNFARGIPVCSVSLALVEAGTPILGVVYDIFRDELFMGGKGLALSLNGEPGHSSHVGEAADAILSTGVPAVFSRDTAAFAELGRFLAPWKKVRMLGSASMMMAYTASGRLDAYFEHNIRFWDVAGGIALMLSAGGSVLVTGTRPDEPLTIAAAPAGFSWPKELERIVDGAAFRQLSWG